MHKLLDRLFGSRFWALFRKEVSQFLHNRQLLIQMLVPPTVFLILFGIALNPTFKDLKVGVTDYSHSRYSREFVELFQQTEAFTIDRYYSDQQTMLVDLARGKLTVAVTIPPTFDRDVARHRSTQVQAAFDAVDANTATVASGYLTQLVSDYNARRSQTNLFAQGTGAANSTAQTNSTSTNNTSTDSTSTNSTSTNSTSGSVDQSLSSGTSNSATNSTDQTSSSPATSQQPSSSNSSSASSLDQSSSTADSSLSSGDSSQSDTSQPSYSTIATVPTNSFSTPSPTASSSNSATSSSSDASSPTSSNPQSDFASRTPTLQQNQVELQTSVFYNPGLEASWFIVPGTIGILMTVLGSQAAASTVVREKEAGTIEQLMMTPASNTQVILAKICPLLVVLTFDAVIALCVAKFVFNIPLRGNIPLFFCISILYFFVGISIGIMIATFAKSEQQAQLTTFFINPPLVLLSGANSPIAAMPTPLQWLTHLDPMRYYIEICRGILLKGVGLESLWHQVIILCLFAIVLTTLSVRQFRRQLS